MCIRDRGATERGAAGAAAGCLGLRVWEAPAPTRRMTGDPDPRCLLYTSDAADERSSVDLGGRRIIKKKNTREETARKRSAGNGRREDQYDGYTQI